MYKNVNELESIYHNFETKEEMEHLGHLLCTKQKMFCSKQVEVPPSPVLGGTNCIVLC